MNNIPAAGIIPYIKLNGVIHFLLGLETSNNKWSGFIGGYEPKDENIITTALREFNEESGMIFENYQDFIRSELSKTTPIIDITKTGRTVYIWFIEFPLEIFYTDISSIFLNNIATFTNPVCKEKSNLRWFRLSSIKNSNVLYNLKKIIKFTFL